MKLNIRPFPFFLLLLVIGYSCTEDPKIDQGEVQYELTYPYMEVDGFLVAVIPTEMTIVFKGTKMKTTITKGRFFETNIISDESNDYLAMYSDMDGKQLYCELTTDELKAFKKSLPNYKYKKTEEQDSIAGVWSRKYEMSSSDSLAPMDAWFAEGFTVQDGAWFTSYDGVVGFPMVYDIERYGIFTHAEAVSFTEKEIADSVFTIEGNYQKVDFETYESESKEIFDLLVNW